MVYTHEDMYEWKRILETIADSVVSEGRAKIPERLTRLNNLVDIDRLATEYGLTRDAYGNPADPSNNTVDYCVPTDYRTSSGYNKLITVTTDKECTVKFYDMIYSNRHGVVLIVDDQSHLSPLADARPSVVEEFLKQSMKKLEAARCESDRILIRNSRDVLEGVLTPC